MKAKRTKEEEPLQPKSKKKVKFSSQNQTKEYEKHDEVEDGFISNYEEKIYEQLEKRKQRFRKEGSDDEDEDYIAYSDEDENGPEEDLDIFNETEVNDEPKNDEDFYNVKNEEIKIEPFNMREEMEVGKFNAEGIFIEYKDEDKKHDSWMTGITQKEMQKAAKAKKELEKRQKEKESEVQLSKEEYMLKIIDFLLPGETILKCLKRLKGTSTLNRQLIENLTGFADGLLQQGYYSVYEDLYEDFVFQLQKSNKLSQDFIPLANTFWQYKIEDQVYGPFKIEEMKSWKRAGYFQEPIWIRRVKEDSQPIEDFCYIKPNFF